MLLDEGDLSSPDRLLRHLGGFLGMGLPRTLCPVSVTRTSSSILTPAKVQIFCHQVIVDEFREFLFFSSIDRSGRG